MNFDDYKELPITEFAFYSEKHLGFALPILSVPHHPSLRAIQIADEFQDNISAFALLDWKNITLKSLNKSTKAQIGSEAIYIFVASDEISYVGCLSELEPTLRQFASKNPNEIATILQIFELIGSMEERRTSRKSMREHIVNAEDSSACAFYDRSALRSAVWRRLVKAAPSAEAARRILNLRTKIEPTTDVNGRITIDLTAIDPSDYGKISIESLTEELQQEFDYLMVEAAQKNIEISGSNNHQTRSTLDVIKRVSSAGRQQQRIAILLDEIIENPTRRKEILNRYQKDRAIIASNMIQRIIAPALLRRTISHDEAELIVASIIPKLYTQEFAMNRGVLLFDLATHLGKYPHINRAIRDRARRSRSYYVATAIDDIEKILNQEKRKR